MIPMDTNPENASSTFVVVQVDLDSLEKIVKKGLEQEKYDGYLHFYYARSKNWKIIPDRDNEFYYRKASVLVFYKGETPKIEAVTTFLLNNLTLVDVDKMTEVK